MGRVAISRVGEILGHRFACTSLLEQALTHPSAGGPARPDNQRFEFLGDRILGLVIAEALFRAYPDASEGELAPRFNGMVRRETLAAVANEIGLGEYLHLGRSEAVSGGRRKSAILADALEALIAALYLDGGMEAASRFILRHWRKRIDTALEIPLDAKTRLQEWLQARGLSPPKYVEIERSGPDHAPQFSIAVELADGNRATGQATSKKKAEQRAAAALLERISTDE